MIPIGLWFPLTNVTGPNSVVRVTWNPRTFDRNDWQLTCGPPRIVSPICKRGPSRDLPRPLQPARPSMPSFWTTVPLPCPRRITFGWMVVTSRTTCRSTSRSNSWCRRLPSSKKRLRHSIRIDLKIATTPPNPRFLFPTHALENTAVPLRMTHLHGHGVCARPLVRKYF